MTATVMTLTVHADLSVRDKADLGRRLFAALIPFLDPHDELSTASINWGKP